MALLTGAASPGRIDLAVEGLRSQRGSIIICLTRDPAHFPDCDGDPASRHMTIAATDPAARFPSLPSGDYALALIHDENGNGRLDKMFGVPREGVGFSRNPRLTLGPPRFAAARFAVGTQPVAEMVRLKYFL
ncbi:DUF2141 domain-containing protein [Sphingomonas solaris]|nr:DUF2141 domain-containing protein [Sphingomonas solaris]